MTAAPVLAGLAEPERWPGLASALGDWVPSQRWFQGKARVVTGVRVVDAALLPGESGVLDLVVEVAYAGGSPERYQVPLVAGDPGTAGADAAARLGGLALRDALADSEACRAVAGLALGGEAPPTAAGGRVRGLPVAPAKPLPEGPARRLGVEQSNSSVVIGDAILKVFRKLEGGLNPDVELTRALTAVGFEHVPAQHGAVVLEHDGTETALAVLSSFAAAAREGWALACEEAAAVAAGARGGGFVAAVAELGAVVARLHAALRDSLGAEPAPPGTAAAWAAGMRAGARQALALARARAATPAAAVLEAASDVDARLGTVADLADPGPLVRIHGDLHLGQVLVEEPARWLVLDFEGEPARPLADRRRPQSPLRDVAGMLRSFDYAAAHADRAVPPGLAAWRDELRRAFLDAYLGHARRAGLLPGNEATSVLLDAFELDKAVYELSYELANRPDWIAIPLGGILRVLDGRG